jgi:hypothetical protein
LEASLFDWLTAKALELLSLVPAMFVSEDSPNFMLIRAMFGLLFIVIFVYIIAMLPLRSTVTKIRTMLTRTPHQPR